MKKKKVMAILLTAALIPAVIACGKEEPIKEPQEAVQETETSPYTLVDEKDEVEITTVEKPQETLQGNGTGADAQIQTIEDVAYANQLALEENPQAELNYIVKYTVDQTKAYSDNTSEATCLATIPKATAVAVWSQDDTGEWAIIRYNNEAMFVDKSMLTDSLETAKAAPPTQSNLTPTKPVETMQPQQTVQEVPQQEVQQTPSQEVPQTPTGQTHYSNDPEIQALMEQMEKEGLVGGYIQDDGSQMKVRTPEEREQSLEEEREYLRQHPNLRFE